MAVTIGCLLLDPVCLCFPRATILMVLKEKSNFQKRISPGNQAGGRSRHNPFLSYVAVDGFRGLVGLLVLMPIVFMLRLSLRLLPKGQAPLRPGRMAPLAKGT